MSDPRPLPGSEEAKSLRRQKKASRTALGFAALLLVLLVLLALLFLLRG